MIFQASIRNAIIVARLMVGSKYIKELYSKHWGKSQTKRVQVGGQVSILQIIFYYYLYKALHIDTLPTEIITNSIKPKLHLLV